MKRKYENAKAALARINELNEKHLGFEYIPEHTTPSLRRGKIGGCILVPSKEKFYGVNRYEIVNELVPKTEKERKNFVKNHPGLISITNECFKSVTRKRKKRYSLVTLSVFNEIEEIIQSFPNDFICEFEETNSHKGGCKFSLYFVSMSLGDMEPERELIFRFYDTHTTTSAREKIWRSIKALVFTKHNKKRLTSVR